MFSTSRTEPLSMALSVLLLYYTLGKNSTTMWNNSCGEQLLDFGRPEKIIIGVMLAIITAVTVMGNTLVVIAVCVVKKLRQPSNYLLVSLAVADLSVAIVVMPFVIVTDLTGGKWLFGEVFCNIFIGMDVMCCTASIMTLCVISVDREKMFLWHLKLMFPQSSSEFSQRRVPDRHTLKQILTTYIHPTESDPVTRQKLKMYVNASPENVKVFMKAEGRKANSVRYHELDTEKSLKDNLSFKMLIEYPVLHVVLRDQWKDYPLKGPAEPASACTSLATKNVGIDGQKRAVDHVSPPSVQTGTNLQTAAEEISPESEPPLQKRAKRGVEEEEQEEGEILDSSDEEEMLERNQAESIPLGNNTSVNDMKNMQHGVN